MKPRALVLAVLLAVPAAAAAAEPRLSFEADARVELVCAALAAGLKAPASGGYARDARRAFGALAGHPAAVKLAAAQRARGAEALARLALALSPPPALALERPLSSAALAALGGAEAAAALVEDLRDFARRGAFEAFFARHRPVYEAWQAEARREARRGLSPAAVEAYLGEPLDGDHRFVLAGLWPDASAVDWRDGSVVFHLRGARPGPGGAPAFGLDSFHGSPADALARDALRWLDPPSPLVRERLAAAVQARVLAQDLGERVLRGGRAADWLDGDPKAVALARGLEEFETARARYKTLRVFAPRLRALARLRLAEAERAARDGEQAAALAEIAAARASNPDAEDLRAAARRLAELGRSDEAERILDELAAASPGDTDLAAERGDMGRREAERLVAQARSQAQAGDKAGALASLQRAQALPAPPAALAEAALLYRRLDEPALALPLIARFVELAPADAGLRLDRADAELSASRPGDAAASLGAALKLKLDAGPARRAASLYARLPDRAAALAGLDALVALFPRDAALRVERAQAETTAGRKARALADLRGLDAGATDAASVRRAAELLLELGEPSQARALLDALVARAPDDAALRLARAEEALEAGDRSAAAVDVDAAEGLRPRGVDRLRLAELRRRLGEAARARRLLEEAAEADPDDAATLRQLAQLYDDLGQTQRALGVRRTLARAAPRDASALVDLGAAAARAGRPDAARRAAAEALALRPDSATRRRLALLLQDLRDYRGALRLLEPLAASAPRDAGLRADLGLCRHLSGDSSRAIADLRAAIALDPSALGAYLTLGAVYAALGRPRDERAAYVSAPASGGEPALRARLEQARRRADGTRP